MSITVTQTIRPKSASNDKSSLTDTNHHHRHHHHHHNHNHAVTPNPEHFVNERYPKTCFEDIPSIILEYPPPKVGAPSTRSHHSLRFRTQPVTLTEINETEEENKTDNDNHQQESQTSTLGDFQRLEHLALWENVRRSARKRLPTKNYLERQRLKAMREEPSETDGS